MRISLFLPALLLLSAGIGCSSPSGDQGHQHGTEEAAHDHGPEPLSHTLYSTHCELFVEFKPLVVGSTGTFAAHFTVLGEQFKPLQEGSVMVSLITANQGIRQTTDTPAVPGIYRLALKPLVAGKSKLLFDIRTKDFSDRIVIDDVMVYPDDKAAMAAQKPSAAPADAITYLKEQAWKVEFANEPVLHQPFRKVVKTSGKLLPAPGDETVIAANAAGIVRFGAGNMVAGGEVKQGNLLFTISGGELAEGNIDAAYRQARTNFETARADYERSTELVKEQIISQQEHQRRKALFENAQTALNTLSKNRSGNGFRVSAPRNGFLRDVRVSDGQYVEAGTILATLSGNRKLLLSADLPQQYFGEAASFTAANFSQAGTAAVYSTQQLGARRIAYGRSTATDRPFLPVTFELDNPSGIIPGSIAEVYLLSDTVPDALTVPLSALIEEQGTFYVYVQLGGETFQKREVRTGMDDGSRIQVLSGLNGGERVVTRGAYQIKLSTASGSLPAHGHEH